MTIPRRRNNYTPPFMIKGSSDLNRILSKVGDLNFRRRVVKMLDYLNIQPGDRVLDMGCGEGFYSMIFDRLYKCDVFAVDSDSKILNMAKSRLSTDSKINFELGDITNLRFENNYFDKILCTEVLEHIMDDHKAAKELFRVLKPGGILAATVPNKNYPFLWDPLNKIRESLGFGHYNPLSGFWGGIWAYDHKRLYLPQDFSELLGKAKFEISKIEVLTHHGLPFNHLILYVGKNMYTKLPVPAEIKSTMEKFDWEGKNDAGVKKFTFGKGVAVAINLVFLLMRQVDQLNNKDFSLDTSSMAVAVKAVKPVYE